ncbi:MAG TPA: DUF2167 domain-containing protein [Chryseolinea sp.]|nr:DUF2167 domain-containing protein [Chryseolinea sp.]
MKQLLTLLLGLSMLPGFASDNGPDSTQVFLDSLESTFRYQDGEIQFDNGLGTLQVPSGFKYLDGTQSQYIIHDLWGNPGGEGTLGMIVPENIPLTSPESWAFIITYEDMGYVKDDDADKINYDDLLGDLQEETEAENEEREKAGYEPIFILGWASKPYYDKDKKVLHWAKEIRFGESDINTLNYNVRVLGRKGVLVLNAVASIDALPAVKETIDPVLGAFNYAEGNAYADFNPDLDEVAVWTIGGLVAGKILAKVGIFALLLKNIKLIGLALVAIVSGIWKWFKRKTEPPVVREIGGGTQG